MRCESPLVIYSGIINKLVKAPFFICIGTQRHATKSTGRKKFTHQKKKKNDFFYDDDDDDVPWILTSLIYWFCVRACAGHTFFSRKMRYDQDLAREVRCVCRGLGKTLGRNRTQGMVQEMYIYIVNCLHYRIIISCSNIH